MVKIVCNTPDNPESCRFWIQVPEPPEKHVEYIRKAVGKYCGEKPLSVTRMAPYQYKLGMVNVRECNVADEIIRLMREDYR